MKAEVRRRLRLARRNLEAAAASLGGAIVDGEITTSEDAFHGYLRDPIEDLIRLHDQLLKTEANDGK